MAKNKVLYSMKETCDKTGLTYDSLKFYCNQGLVPNVKEIKVIIVCLMIMILTGLEVYLV